MARRDKQKHRRGKPGRRGRDGPVLVEHPFSGLDPELLRGSLIKMSKASAEEYPKLLARFDELFRTVNPASLLSMILAGG